MRDIIRATFDRRIFQSWVEKLKESTKTEIKKPIEAVNNIVRNLGLLATRKQREAMHKFGVKDIPENLSKREVSEVLDRLVGFQRTEIVNP